MGLEASLALAEEALAAERQARAAEQAAAAKVAAERDRLRDAYEALQVELELLRRRLFVAKAERVDSTQLEFEFAEKLAELDKLGDELAAKDAALAGEPSPGAEPATGRGASKPHRRGRRDFSELDLPEERIELPDPTKEGDVERIGFEESSRLRWRRASMVRVVLARVKYREEPSATEEPSADATTSVTMAASAVTLPAMIYTTPMPPEILPRAIGTPSLYAHIVADKLCDGLPLYRQEDRFSRLGCRIDRGTMSRWLEDLGMIVGNTVVAAARDEAMRTAFCLSTDATGVLVQPIREGKKKKRQPCRRGHYFVQIADRDHVFFEYVPRETSAAVSELFRGFGGYIQADAKSVYDILFRPPEERPPPDDGEPDLALRHEVGCWSHQRRKLWEATIAKDPTAREGLARVNHMFELERSWRGRPAAQKKRLRDARLRPHLDDFFAWASTEYEKVKGQRGLLRSALGYACRQKAALMRFLDDGRLRMDNNESERELRRIATGRKAWLFVGSDDHAQAAGNLLSLIASARLHRLDPEAYLRDLFRVLPHWPRGRFLELAPRYWLATRDRLDPAQLEMELGPLTIPPPLPTPQ